MNEDNAVEHESERDARWVVVTGASGGIGSAICRRAVGDGFHVLALGRDLAVLSALSAEHEGRIVPLDVDLRDRHVGEIVEGFFADSVDTATVFGFVHAAGISVGSALESMTDDAWEHSMDVNVTSAMRVLRSILPRLKEASNAAVVLVSSPVALIGARKVSYSASKAALLGLNAALASQLGVYGIRVNALLPGPTITGMTEDWDEAKRADIAAQGPLGRLCRPEESAAVVSFLLGPDSSALTGTIIDATGGRHIGL